MGKICYGNNKYSPKLYKRRKKKIGGRRREKNNKKCIYGSRSKLVVASDR